MGYKKARSDVDTVVDFWLRKQQRSMKTIGKAKESYSIYKVYYKQSQSTAGFGKETHIVDYVDAIPGNKIFQ